MVDELYEREPCWDQPPGVRRCAVRRKERCMQLAVFDDDRLAVVDGDVLIDVTDALGATGPDGPLRAFLDAGGGLAQLAALDLTGLPRRELATARLAPPVLPRAVIAAPVNYRDHQQEMHEQRKIGRASCREGEWMWG